MRGVGAAQQGQDPGWRSLLAGYQAFGAELWSLRSAAGRMRNTGGSGGAYDSGCRIHGAREGVDGDYMGGFVVPGAVFLPVGCRNFLPGVVERAV